MVSMAHRGSEHASAILDWATQIGRATELVLATPTWHLKKGDSENDCRYEIKTDSAKNDL